jgi:hypothetical protein
LARTGLPVNIVVSRSASNMLDGNSSNQRPDLVAGASIIPAGGQTINQWWNLAAFAVPAKNTWGNLGHNIGRAPGFYILNHAILNAPPANVAAPATFGRITGSGNPRKLQLMFRVEF